jgi:serpin B
LALTSGENYTAAALPYEGGANAVIVLPDQGRFDDVAAALTVAGLHIVADAEPVGMGALGLPKFTSDSCVQELTPALQSAGVKQLFTQTPHWPMFGSDATRAVDFVKHRVVVAVNEPGTEAAAATAVGGLGGDGPQLTFIVDRPFLTAILDADGAVLFLAQVTDPR